MALRSARCRPYPQELYSEQSLEHPLIGTRADVSDSRVGETPESLPLLERLLRCSHVDAHSAIAENLWDRSANATMPATLKNNLPTQSMKRSKASLA